MHNNCVTLALCTLADSNFKSYGFRCQIFTDYEYFAFLLTGFMDKPIRQFIILVTSIARSLADHAYRRRESP